MAKASTTLYEKIAPLILLVVIALSFSVGMLWQRVSALERGTVRNAGTAQAPNAQAPGGGEAPAADGKLSEERAAQIPEITSEDHIRGNAEAEVVLIEYSDYECPFCGRFHETAKQVVEEYGDQVAWVYRHFPLDSIHPNAREAAEASECIAELGGQDAFWAFTDEIFELGTSSLSDLNALAVSAGVNEGAFTECLESGRYSDKVEAQYQGGLAAGVTGTPGNFIINQNGEAWLVPGAVPFATIEQTIEKALGNTQ